MEEQLQYKYLIAVDGWAAPWERVPAVLASNSLLLKQESPFVEWFYDLMIPGVHYVPVKYDLSDLVDKIKLLLEIPGRGIVQGAHGGVNLLVS